ncbi:hypothetical protein WJX77_003183 [Trebouxia sp. C0004]
MSDSSAANVAVKASPEVPACFAPVLTTGYVHVLGDAFPILTDPCLARADSNDDVAKAADRKVRLKAIQNIVISYTFEAGIIFHSIFIGITLGISSNADTVRSLMIALIFHQGFGALYTGAAIMALIGKWA